MGSTKSLFRFHSRKLHFLNFLMVKILYFWVLKRIYLFLVAVIYIVGCSTPEPRPRWNVKLSQKYRSGKIIKTDSSIIEYGKYRNFNRFYEISKNGDTSSFYSFETQTNFRKDTFIVKDIEFDLGFITIRDSLTITTNFGKHKIIKIFTDSRGVSDDEMSYFYLPSGRPIIRHSVSWGKYYTFSSSPKDEAIIEALENDNTCFFLHCPPPLPPPPF